MKKALIVIVTITLSGCWTTKRQACDAWLKSGEVASSYEYCMQCAQIYGTSDLRSVRDCAFKKEIGRTRDGF